MSHIQHLIIAGSNKCGTTSLYRYLSDHPAVCGSTNKETDFFHHNIDYNSSVVFDRYMQLFPGLSDQHRFCVEATPTYFDSGRLIANRINELVADAHILLLLRDPTDRLVSYYRSKQGLATSIIAGLSFAEFVDKAMYYAANPHQATSQRAKTIGRQISKAYYSPFLAEYLEIIRSDHLHLMFFESIRDATLETMQSLCTAIGLDTNFYSAYTFNVENRSRFHRSSSLRTLATKINSAAEPLLNHAPSIRRGARLLYNAVNTVKGKGHSFEPEQLEILRDHFRPHNDSLRVLLERELQIKEFPEWLSTR